MNNFNPAFIRKMSIQLVRLFLVMAPIEAVSLPVYCASIHFLTHCVILHTPSLISFSHVLTDKRWFPNFCIIFFPVNFHPPYSNVKFGHYLCFSPESVFISLTKYLCYHAQHGVVEPFILYLRIKKFLCCEHKCAPMSSNWWL